MPAWKRKLIETERGKFEVFRKGIGRPICVTHHYSAFNETGDLFADTFTDRHEVILVNLREAGASEKAHEPYQLSMLESVFDLEAVRTALGFESWIFAGHSTGGMLGLLYGIYFSDSLEALIAVGAAAREYATFSEDCIYNPGHPQFEKMQALIEALKDPVLSAHERKRLAAERTKLSLYRPERVADLFPPDVHKKIAAARMDFFNRDLQIYDVTRKLSLVTAPALIICGRHDVQCPLLYSREIAAEIPNAVLSVFEESNHYPFLEEAERFKKETADFLHTAAHQRDVAAQGKK